MAQNATTPRLPTAATVTLDPTTCGEERPGAKIGPVVPNAVLAQRPWTVGGAAGDLPHVRRAYGRHLLSFAPGDLLYSRATPTVGGHRADAMVLVALEAGDVARLVKEGHA